MKSASSYGEVLADVYDDLYSEAPQNAIDYICSILNKEDKVLELGIGTGRFAIPLALRGVDIFGVDASPSMLEKLKEKKVGSDIPVELDDFATLYKVEDNKYQLVFCNFSSFFLLPTQDLQIQSFQNTAKKLVKGGQFILETFFPDTSRYGKDQPIYVNEFREDNEVIFETNQHNSIDQTIRCRFVRLSNDKVSIIPVELRYAWPAELDLMASSAGMELEHRWAGWDQSEFQPSSFKYISVFKKITD